MVKSDDWNRSSLSGILCGCPSDHKSYIILIEKKTLTIQIRKEKDEQKYSVGLADDSKLCKVSNTHMRQSRSG